MHVHLYMQKLNKNEKKKWQKLFVRFMLYKLKKIINWGKIKT